MLKHFYRSIDIIVADSNFGKEEVVEHYGFPKEKVRTIYLGGGENYKPMDKNEAKSIVSQKYKIDSPYILDVSRLQPHKNVGGLIRAYDLMRKTNPNRTEKLVIVGGGAYNKVPEYGIAEQATFSKDIRFVDFVDKADLNAVYSASELFVFPSLNEGFGLPVVEAMASGVPVITSNITSMPEIGGDAVITVNPLDISGLAGTMHMVLTDRVLQRKMIELGLNRASGFTWGKTVRDTEDLYK